MASIKKLGNNKRKAVKAVKLSDTDSDEDMCVLEYIKKKQTCLPVMPQVKVMVERLDITKYKNNFKVGNSAVIMERGFPIDEEGSSAFLTVMPEAPEDELQNCPPQSRVIQKNGSTTYKYISTDVVDSDEDNNVTEGFTVTPQVFYGVKRFISEQCSYDFKERSANSGRKGYNTIERGSILSSAIVQQSANELCLPRSLENHSIAVDKDFLGTSAERVVISNMDCDEDDHFGRKSFSEDVTCSTYSPVLPHFAAIQQLTCSPNSNRPNTQVAFVERAKLGHTDYSNAEVVEISAVDSSEECEVTARNVPFEQQSAVDWPTSNSTQCSTVRVDSGSSTASADENSVVDSDEEEKDPPMRYESVGEWQQVPSFELQQRPTISSNKQFVTVPLTSIEMMANAVNNGAEFVALKLNANNLEHSTDSEFLNDFYSLESIFICIICDKVAHNWVDMQVHLQFHFKEKTFQCEICRERFCFKGELDRHIANHAVTEFSCNFCGNKFQKKNALETHLFDHFINVEFPTLSALEIHFKQKDGTNFDCKLCGGKFRADALKRHLLNHFLNGHWLCIVCSQEFPTLSSLKFHFKQAHGTNFDCKICAEKFNSFDKLKEHFVSHFQFKLFKCKLCGEKFPKRCLLEFHLQKSHNLHFRNCLCEDCVKKNEEEKNNGKPEKYICDKCGKEFNSSKNFNAHLNIHRDRPFKCDICKKAYFRKGMLISHKKQHEHRSSEIEFGELSDKKQ